VDEESDSPDAGTVTRHVEEYDSGRFVDVLRTMSLDASPVVLLWHGSGPDERDALVPLASAIAAHGPVVLAPDWQSADLGIGAGELLASIAFVHARAADLGADPGRVVLAGWSLGASAVADIALHPDFADGWCPSAIVGLAGGYDRSPFGDQATDRDPMGGEPEGGAGRPALLFHGTSDHVIPLQRSVHASEVLAGAGWQVTLRQMDCDHAGVIGTIYDRQLRRCVPSDDPGRHAVMSSVARQVARLALGPD
jgi:predicted esterase